VGPDDILVVAGQSRVMRLPNPTARRTHVCEDAGSRSCTPKGGVSLPYTAPEPGDPGSPAPADNLNALRAAVATSETSLDAWLGPAILGEICAGGFDPRTCLIQYPTVRYDQMHGHFLVAFAVTDTGVRGADVAVSEGRASTWVLLVSRRASFVQPDGTVPAQVFTPPVAPPDGLDADWYVHYGRRDGPGPSGFLSLNMYSTHPAARPLSAPGRFSDLFPESNCAAPAGAQPPLSVSAPAGEETVCLFPTEVRLGLDGDSVVLVSPVYNVNQIVVGSNTVPFTTGRYAGNRVRVLSKFALYNFAAPLADGTWLDPGPFAGPVPYDGDVAGGLGLAAPAQTQFDLFRDTDLPAYCTVFDFATDTCFTPLAGFPPRRYTLGLEVSPTGSGLDFFRPPANPTTPSALSPLYYEPVHLRGRALATYASYPFGGLTHLLGSYSSPFGGDLWVQPIVYRADYRPALDAGDQTGISISGPRRQLVPDTAIAPLQVPQAGQCSTEPCSSGAPADPANNLFVGDARPQRAVAREGHLYDARVGRPSSNSFGTSLVTPPPLNANTANQPLWATVYHDVIQMRYTSPVPPLPSAGSTSVFTLPLPDPGLVFHGGWQNGHFSAPMFDVPADVQLSGPAPPASLEAFLGALFVGTTSPRLLFPDPSTEGNGWPSLFDLREGLDKFDRFESRPDPVSGRVVNPVTGATTTNVLATRNGGATDPNAGGLWTYGAFADKRLAGVGQWATHAAYREPESRRLDAYGQPQNFFADVCPPGEGDADCRESPLFAHVQTARRLGLTLHLFGPDGEPLGSAGADPAHGIPGRPVRFEPGRPVTRAELAAFVVYGTMDEAAVADYLAQTTGGLAGSTFTDVATGLAGSDPQGRPAVLTEAQRRAIELLARRGYGAGCSATQFCPFDLATRGELAVLVVRAKLASVHPTVIAGCPTPADPAGCVAAGDNFWRLVAPEPYFPTDVPPAHPLFGYVQTLRALGLDDGAGRGRFVPDGPVTRGALVLLALRAFHF
jgi:hypothetical protein